MAIHLGALPGVLISPTKTFESLKSDASMANGLKLIVLIMVIYFGISLVGNVIQFARMPAAFQGLMAGVLVMTVIGTVVMIALGIVGFLFTCWLISKLTAAIGGKPSNFGKTVGLMAYVEGAFTLLIMVPIMIIVLIISLASPVTVPTYGYNATPQNMGGMMAFGLLMLVGIILLLIWEWLIAGRAAATANDTTWGAGIAGVLIAAIIIAVIVFIIAMIITAIIIGMVGTSMHSYSYGPSGWAFLGL